MIRIIMGEAVSTHFHAQMNISNLSPNGNNLNLWKTGRLICQLTYENIVGKFNLEETKANLVAKERGTYIKKIP